MEFVLCLGPRDLRVEAHQHPRGQAHLSSASSLVRVHGMMHVVADDEHHLGSFEEAARPATPHGCFVPWQKTQASDGGLRDLYPLHGAPKVEGIAVQAEGDTLVVTLVTDADDPAIPSQLLEVRLPFS